MLLEYQITNFKSFAGPVNIPIKPITLIFGPNSSGKSSIFQSLLMLKQTFEEGREEVLHPRGNLVDLGSFKEFIFEQNLRHSFSFKMTFKKPARFFPAPPSPGFDAELGYVPEDDFYRHFEESINFNEIALSKTYAVSNSANLIPFISKIDLFLGDKKGPILSYVRKGSKNDFIAAYNFHHNYWRSYWETFDKEKDETLPEFGGGGTIKVNTENINNLFNEYIAYRDEEIKTLKAWVKRGQSKKEVLQKKLKLLSDQIRIITNLEGFEKAIAVYSFVIDASENFKCFLQGDESQAFSVYGSRGIDSILQEKFPSLYGGYARDPSFFREVTEELMEKWLSNIIYIGPLREFPQRYYMGENLLNGFWKDFWLEKEFRSKTALAAINKEIRKYGLDYKLKADDIYSSTSNIKVASSIRFVDNHGISINMRDVGFGYSQILPIVIQSILAREKTFLIEQPELHLHPALQAEIGDLFIKTALGKQKNTFLLETHSEHLILRLLRRIRETTCGELPNGAQPITPDQLAVLYVQQGKNGSEVINIPVTEDGEFDAKWPNGFFTEREKELF
jgi:AAA15 family ATPase/GTPase